ncbi:hypothetical protein AOL_s00081g87 [Orbilia oligospora ATCC 24927]|uniref:feruloyl esterase n=1 Tax=Arthrobotrys oligospora (strain ATCC 24927 / CBS 115.81 / DSM 1491) TaxID=756982 RepID=G1XFE5_ARTOA|nr:hypothetical protein AOL_s00081g87 [Orbilia oligospora ATCC 24927]EGX48091.1 hypothetical protein AOL_s00081g87 [Orbilia oligospora ATCC 24927]
MTRLLPIILATIALIASTVVADDDRTPGCGKDVSSAAIGKTQKVSITSSGNNRTFMVHLPQDYDSDEDYPVILGFHGAPGVGLHFEADTMFSMPRWGNGKIFVYPDALGGVWAGMPGNMTTPLEKDLEFMSDLLNYLRNNYCVDNEKIYATGISNGGGFLNRIACDPTVGRNFAAFAPDAGAFTGFQPNGNATCNPYKTPIPIISFHGTNDTTISYYGRNDSIPTPSIPYWLQGWVERNKCTNMTEETYNKTATHYSWTCDGVEGAFQHYKVEGMGHVWPSTEETFSQLISGGQPTVVNANQLILDFFGRWEVEDRGVSGGGETTAATTTTAGPTPTETGGPAGTTAAGGGSAAGRVEVGMWSFGVAVLVGLMAWV